MEWFSTFSIFENLHISADHVYCIFRNSIKKNRQFRPRPRARTLKSNIFIWKFAETFIIHQQSTKIKFKIYFLFSENGQHCFWPVHGQNKYFFEFLSIFSFTKNQRIHSPLSQAWKTFQIFLCADFSVAANIFWGPATKERGNIET